MVKVITLATMFLVSGAGLAEDGRATDGLAKDASAPVTSRSEKDSGPLIKAPKPKKGNRREQKETEGSEALERFQADTILKSPYTIDGQPLEVDPD